MDYRKQITDELTRLIAYHENELQTYLHIVGSKSTDDGDSDKNAFTESYSWLDSDNFAKKVKLMAVALRDYEMIGMCEALLQATGKIQSEEFKIYQQQEDDWISETRFNLKEYLDNKAFFSASDIGCYFHESPHAINRWLTEDGFQHKTEEGLVPTDLGIPFLKKVIYTQTGKKTCRWGKAIVHALAVSRGKAICQDLI